MADSRVRDDLTGKIFGQLEVMYYVGNNKWHCRCSCGREKDIRRYSLTTTNSKYKVESCGHTRSKENLELVGQTFGDIRVIGSVGRGRYRAICNVCGREKLVSGGDIRRGKAIKCTYVDPKNYIGKLFGELKVIELKGRTAVCECSCGNIVEYPISRLANQHSCGCLKRRKQLKNSLEGKHQGYLDIEELLDNNIYRCKCICGKEIMVTASNLRLGQKSCGCMASILHSKTIDNRLNRQRSEEQLNAIKSRDNLVEFITSHSFIGKISLTRLSELLGLESLTSAAYYIDKFDMREYIIDNNTSSQPEADILEYIKGISNERVLTHYKKLLRGKEIDIYLPDKKIAIEYNGSYWHSDINKPKEYHQQKTLDCAKQGVRLIHIFGYDWSTQRNKIKSIINNAINTRDLSRIYARNTIVSEIEYSIANSFLEKYHLQNGTKSSVYIGLYYESELIAVMALGEPQLDKKYNYEVHRLCFKPNVVVIGGTQKMLKYFIRNYDPTSIVAYVDISKFTGNGYLRLGFKLTQENWLIAPDYKWVYKDESEVLDKYQAQKYMLLRYNIENTEDNIMGESGFYKVYDSGNLKLEWLKENSNG